MTNPERFKSIFSRLLMLKFLQEYQKKRNEKRILLAFRHEVDKNLEAYYVMFQIGKLRAFSMNSYETVKNDCSIVFGQEVMRYVDILGDYNQSLKDFKEYEQWYAADSQNKTKDNARILHTKNAAAKQKFQGLEDIIKSAQDSLVKQLVVMKVLKG